MRSYQATTAGARHGAAVELARGLHSLWLPIIPLQIGLVLKPGPQEPWTPWRMCAGVLPGGGCRGRRLRSIRGSATVGAAVLNNSPRS